MIDLELNGETVTLQLERMCDDKARFNVLMKSLMQGAIVVRDSARKKFQQRLGNSSFHHSEDVGGPLYNGITVKYHGDYIVISVGKDYRLRWFEKGTKPRKTKNAKVLRDQVKVRKKSNKDGKWRKVFQRSGKGGNRGIVTSLRFLKDAGNETRGQVDIVVKKALNDGMKKLLNKFAKVR